MQSTHLLAFIFTFFAFGAFAQAVPVTDKRQTAPGQLMTILVTLNSSVNAVIPNIRSFTSASTSTDLAPYMQQMQSAFSTASSALGQLSVSDISAELSISGMNQDIALLVATLFEGMFEVMLDLLSISGLGMLLLGLAREISEFLMALEALLEGELLLIAGSLDRVIGLFMQFVLGLFGIGI